MPGDILNAVGVPNQALLFRRLLGLQHLVNGRAESSVWRRLLPKFIDHHHQRVGGFVRAEF
jgi:hypothetical protein